MSSDDRNMEDRVTSLERFAEAVTIRQDGEDQLQEGVSRLSDETSALTLLLTKVDSQQQQLSAIDRRTELVEETAVSRDELINAHDEQEQLALDFRKQTLKRIYLTGMSIGLILFTGIGTFLWVDDKNTKATYKLCMERNEEGDILHDILVGLTKDVPPEAQQREDIMVIREGIQRLEDKIVDCEAIF